MKKFVIAIGTALVILIISSYKLQLIRQPSNLKKTENIKYVSLNGLSEESVEQSISDFVLHKDEDNRPEIVSVWFSSTTIKRMVKLLCSERADGLRIYYIADPSGTPYLKASIALVSTKTKPIIRPGQSKHRDYYDHNFDDELFSDTIAIKGELRNDDCDGGALLYKRSGKLACVLDSSYYISRQDAENMVVRNNGHKHVINTISEWFGISRFMPLLTDQNFDGIRIYFARRKGLLGVFTTGRNSFLITTTVAIPGGPNGTIHRDDFDCKTSNPLIYGYKSDDKSTPPQDNGELCPNNCN